MSKRLDGKDKPKNSYKSLHSTKNSKAVIQPPPVIPDPVVSNVNRSQQPRKPSRMPLPAPPAALRKNTQFQPVAEKNSKNTTGIQNENNNKCVERISSCLLNQVRKMRSDTDLTKSQQAYDLERLKALKMEEMNDTEQEVYHLYSQTASIDQTCTRISKELDTILGKHEYIKQLREHSRKKDNLLKFAIRQNQIGEQVRTMKEQTFSFTIANASVSARQSTQEMPLVDTLKRNLETKLDKLRFLQSVADGIKAEASTALETKMQPPRVSDQGFGSPLTGTTSHGIPAVIPSKLTLQNVLRHDQLTHSSYTDGSTLGASQAAQSQQGPHQDSDELESVPEELEDVQGPSSFGSDMETIISDYEEEALYADEDVLTDEEVFPSSREEDNWADSEGESDTSRQTRTPRPRAPSSNTTSNSQRSTDENHEVPVPLANVPLAPSINLDDYAPPKVDFMRVKPAVQPLKAHIFPWMEQARNNAEDLSRKVAGSSSPARSLSETSVVSYKKSSQWPINFDEDKGGSHRNLITPEEPLIVKGKAIPPQPPNDPDKIDLKEKASRLPAPNPKKAKAKPKPASIITEIPATELMADVSTVLEPPKMTELLEKVKRPIVPKPKRPSLNVAKSNRPVSRPSSAKIARPASTKNGRPTSAKAKKMTKPNKSQLTKKNSKVDTIYHNTSSISSDDSEMEIGKEANDSSSPQKAVWVMTPGATSTKQVIYGTFEAGSDDESSQVKPNLLSKKSPTMLSPDMATATEGRVKFRKVSMRMDPVTKPKTNRFSPINTLPPLQKPSQPVTLADDKVLLAKIIPDSRTRKAVANGIENISRIIDSKTAIRKNRPLTPVQLRTEYRSNFTSLGTKRSEYKALNSFRKPPVPSHIVQTQGPKPPESVTQLAKKTSASGNHFLKNTKRTSLADLSGPRKSKSKIKMDTMKRAKVNYSRTALLEDKSKTTQTKKPLPDHLAFGNFTGLKSQRSARVTKPETKGFSLIPQAASARTNREPMINSKLIRNIKDLKPKKSLFPTSSKFSQSRFLYTETK